MKDTKSTKVKLFLIPILLDLLRKYICGEDLENEKAASVPSYPRKRVSRPIRGRANLDSRVRGNDESRHDHK
jgi:hypothetical protein